MVQILNRWGKKRKASASRYSSGRLIPERGEDRLTLALRMPHRGPIAQPLVLDQKAECELGRRCLCGDITETQYQAGRLFAGIVARYRAVLEGPKAILRGGRGFDCRGDLACEDCECLRRRQAFQEASSILYR